VGIVGAGQLARMLCEAASALGVATFVLAENADDAATPTAGDVAIGSPRDPAALAALAARCDVVTFDHELVDLDTVAALEAQGAAVRPGSAALRAAVDKAHQRRDFRAAGLPVPDFAVLGGTAAEDRAALESLARRSAGHPVVKAARGGYDGRGVVLARTFDEAVDAALAWRAEGTVVVAEAPCRFRAELAALVARRPNGDTVAWRPVETAQLDGICREVRVPGTVDDPTAKEATDLALRVADHLGVVGVLAVELFDTHDGLVVNEVATRPHNSGHWTIEGATTSQFENHLRAVLDLPLGSTELRAPAVVSVNVLGGEHGDPSAVAAALAVPQAKVHLYGKSWRPGRKLGHVTVVGEDPDGVAAAAWRAATALGNPMPPGRTVPS
jgi:5-(carboxyamino)imidazole ribonucleotide synthase